uniref:DUF418 domain-containing protein n=1 Tax=Caulobacter sp. (strain K31) TaxID=366602 RepID=B0T5F0_CAUSK
MQAAQPSRIDLIDSLRGFALLGLFLVHMVELFELYWAHPTPSPVVDWVFGLFAGKAFALFALCFGLSFYIIMQRAAARGVAFGGRFVWRLAILLGFGLIHGLLYRGDILQVLAPLGLALLLFDKVQSIRTLFLLALLCFVQPPLIVRFLAALQDVGWAIASPRFLTDPTLAVLTDGTLAQTLRANLVDGQMVKWWFFIETGRLTQILGLFLVGLALGRSGFFETPQRYVTARRLVLAASLLLYAGLTLWQAPLLAAAPAGGGKAMGRQSLQWILESWAALSLMTAQLVLFVELYEGFAGKVLRLLAPAGRMTLTLYLGQSLVFVPVFYGFGLHQHDRMSEGTALALGLVAFALQLVFAHLWFRRFHYGPCEWLWRALTYTTLDVPFVRKTRPALAMG